MLKLPKISINVNDKPMKFIIDTGTSVNLISETTYLQNFEKSFKPDTSKIFPYCQSEVGSHRKIYSEFKPSKQFHKVRTNCYQRKL